MAAEVDLAADRPRFTVVAEAIAEYGWHVTVRDRSDIWTVAFTAGEVEPRARHRIALDTGLDPRDFDIDIAESPVTSRRATPLSRS